MSEKDLKCCGNCLYRIALDMGEYVEERCEKRHQTSSFEYCNSWEYDGLNREFRTEGFLIEKV